MIRLATASALVLLASALASELRFAPREGLELSTRFELEGRLELTSMEMTVDGASHGGMETPELSIEERADYLFQDRYETVAEGRVTRLVRTYEELSRTRLDSIEGHEGAEEHSREAESRLEGQAVVFEWDPQDEAYAAAFDGEDDDSSLLEGLQARLDLAGFLPAGEVDEGAEWDVPPGEFTALLRPGGELRLEYDEPPAGPQLDPRGELDGSIRATLRPAREEEGLELAVIGLELELTAVGEQALEDGTGEERQLTEVELSGELLWIPAAGRLHALELSGERRVSVITRREVAMGGQDFETVRTLELVGPLTLRLRAQER